MNGSDNQETRRSKMTESKAKKLFHDLMPEEDAVKYVPIQKFTIAMCMLALSSFCKACGKRKCEGCLMLTTAEKLEFSLGLRPFLDENLNLIDPDKGTIVKCRKVKNANRRNGKPKRHS